MTRSRRVLVTGAAGFIGTRVKTQLLAQGHEVVAVEHRWHSREELQARIAPKRFAECIHLGWYARPGDYLTNTSANLRSLTDALTLVECIGALGCEHLVVAGSCAEYGPSDGVVSEDARIGPWSVYGAAKTALRVLLESSWRPAGLGVTWARLFNVTGPGEDSGRLVPSVARALLRGENVPLSPGEQRRDFLDVDDVASALGWLSAQRAEGVFNVCSGNAVTLRHLLGAIADRIGAPTLLQFGARDYGLHDPMILAGDNTRLVATGWARARSFSEMVDRTVEYWTAHTPVGVPTEMDIVTGPGTPP
jgi:nucleoside-diphosphate-sugar epimerase